MASGDTSSRISRRVFLGGLGWAAIGCATGTMRSVPTATAGSSLVELEARMGGRVGLFALNTNSGQVLAHRADERFALCSTFKWLLAAAVLARVDRKNLALDERVRFGPADIIELSPVTSEHVGQGQMSLVELAKAAVVTSDNTAANLLLTLVGGPAGLTAFLRAQGDEVSRLDRNEPALNTNLAGDPRDTTSPRAMVGTLRTLLTTDALSAASRERLIGWMVECQTGGQRLRAGLPPHWRVGDKTGTGARGAVNDVAIAWPAKPGPLLLAAYLSDSTWSVPELNVVHAELGRLVAQTLFPDEVRPLTRAG